MLSKNKAVNNRNIPLLTALASQNMAGRSISCAPDFNFNFFFKKKKKREGAGRKTQRKAKEHA